MDQAQLVLLSIHQAQRSTSRIEKLIRKTMDELEVRGTTVSSPGSTYDSTSSVDLGSPDTLETKVDEESKDIDDDQLDLDLPPTPSSQSSARHTQSISPVSSVFMTQPLQDQANGHVNGDTADVVTVPKSSSNKAAHPDPEAQEMVIDSLRSQIQDLFSQVSQLNNKLVQSYDRVSDLEDQLHDASNGIRSSSLKISQLELERTQHVSALNSGLLVERSHVTAELTRLMEKATEEAARRGQAESARAEIEKDLDDLSAGLFGQANTMVAEARLGKAASERKVEETERALKTAEEAIADMQLHMQAMQAEKEEAQYQLEDIRVTMGKGKWVQRHAHPDFESSKRLLSSHAQYRDFLYFVSFLREQRQKSPQIPTMSTLLSHSFLSRLQTEDSCVLQPFLA
jgi:GDP/GTP exchange factor Sec2p